MRDQATEGASGTLSADEAAVIRVMRESKVSGKELLRRANSDFEREKSGGSKGENASVIPDVERVVGEAVQRATQQQKFDESKDKIKGSVLEK